MVVDLIFTPFMLVLGQFVFSSLPPKFSCLALFCRCQPLLAAFPRLHEHWLKAEFAQWEALTGDWKAEEKGRWEYLPPPIPTFSG